MAQSNELTISSVLADDYTPPKDRTVDFTINDVITGVVSPEQEFESNPLDYPDTDGTEVGSPGIAISAIQTGINIMQEEKVASNVMSQLQLQGDYIPVDIGVDTYMPGVAIPTPTTEGTFTQLFDAAGNLLDTVKTPTSNQVVTTPEGIPSKDLSEMEQIRSFVYGHETPGTDPYQKAGFVSSGRGDKGGVSYGIYQYATTTGSARGFASWSSFSDQFKGKRPGTSAFSSTWKRLATDPNTRDKFLQEQHQYNFVNYYEPVKNNVRTLGLNLDERSTALKAVAMSSAVQHGPGSIRKDNGAYHLFRVAIKRAGGPQASDDQIIKEFYNERSKVEKYFKSSPKLWGGLRSRFKREKLEALSWYYRDRRRYAGR